jgi:putative ABC transport system permease protein
VNGFLLDVRYALRSLRQSPGFALAAALTLALGIGANTLLFSVVSFVLLRPLPYADPDRLMFVAERQAALPEASLAYPTFLDLREAAGQAFSHFAAFRRESFNLTGAGEPERLRGRMVSADLFPALGTPAFLGRTFRPEEDAPGAPRTAVLSWELWQRRVGGDRGVLGRSIELNGEPFEVIGVLRREFRFFSGADLYVPIGLWQDLYRDRGHHPGIYGIGRLRPGVTHAHGLAVLDSVHERLEQQYPESNKGSRAKLEPLRDELIGEVRTPLLVLWGAVAMVLLIAGANVANLLLARASARQQEIAVRLAMGASRARLVRQLLTETAVLAIAGGSAGVLLAVWGTDAIRPLLPATVLRVGDLRVDALALGFTLALSLAAALVFGLVPALRASSIDLHTYLKEGRAVVGGSRAGVRSGLVVAEVALALVLLIGAGLLLRSFARLTRVQPGFDPEHVITLSMSLSPARYGTSETLVRFARDLRERAAALPGVTAAALTYGLPLGEAADQSVWPEGRPTPTPEERQEAMVYATTPGYLEAMRIPLLRGRFFTDADGGSHPVCVIDDAFARKLFAGEEPLGRRLVDEERGPGKGPEIVGVVGHVLQFGLDGAGPVQLGLYVPYRATAQRMPKFAGNVTLVVRAAGDPRALEPALREAVRSIDSEQPVFGVQTMEEAVSRSLGDRRFSLALLVAFAALAVSLALVGIYGVMSYSVAQRTREIGIRMALGAAQSRVLGLVIAQGARLAALGVAIGIASALALSRVLRTLLFGVSATDPLTYAAIGGLLALVALGACWLPARRAARVDPVIALRAE